MNALKSMKRLTLAVLKGTLVFVFGALTLSACFYFFTVNEAYIPIARNALMLLAAFFTGLFASKSESSKGYLRGFFAGLALVILFTVVSKISGGGNFISSVITYSLMLIIAIIGGMIGINAK